MTKCVIDRERKNVSIFASFLFACTRKRNEKERKRGGGRQKKSDTEGKTKERKNGMILRTTRGQYIPYMICAPSPLRYSWLCAEKTIRIVLTVWVICFFVNMTNVPITYMGAIYNSARSRITEETRAKIKQPEKRKNVQSDRNADGERTIKRVNELVIIPTFLRSSIKRAPSFFHKTGPIIVSAMIDGQP